MSNQNFMEKNLEYKLIKNLARYLAVILLVVLIIQGFISLWNPFNWKIWNKSSNLQQSREKPNDVTNWKIYENSKYGFLVKYPLDFITDANSPQKYSSDEIWLSNDKINLLISGPITKTAFNDYGIDYENKKINSIHASKIIKLPAIEGYKSVSFEQYGELNSYNTGVWTLIQTEPNKIIEIYLSGNIKYLQDMRDINNLMVSTFKFTK